MGEVDAGANYDRLPDQRRPGASLNYTPSPQQAGVENQFTNNNNNDNNNHNNNNKSFFVLLPDVQVAVGQIPNCKVVCCSNDVDPMRKCPLLRHNQSIISMKKTGFGQYVFILSDLTCLGMVSKSNAMPCSHSCSSTKETCLCKTWVFGSKQTKS